MKMTKYIWSILVIVLFFVGCSVKKNLEISAPFELGEAFGQEWIVEGNPKKTGYDVIIPIISLDEDAAVLHNLYHLGQMADVKIELREIGMVAVVEFPSKNKLEKPGQLDGEPFPFLLNEAEAVLSFVYNDKVRYIKINGIRQNPRLSYPNLLAKRGN